MCVNIQGWLTCELLYSEMTFPSIQARKLFYMDYTKGEMFKSAKVYHDQTFTSALTAHPFKTSDLLYGVHQFFLEISMKNNDKKGLQIKKELEAIQKKTKKAKAFP